MQYIIRSDIPFRGSIQTHILDDGTVAYSDGLTPDQYAADRNLKIRVIDDAELDALNDTFLASCITEPTEETEAQFIDALECLPPSKWRVVRGVELFHISERLTQNLVSWHAKLNGRYFTFDDRDNADMENLAGKVAAHFQSISS